ncbi:hypothetical protein YZ82_01460 [Campylobacter hyointestinalis]|uniref:Uncharacterized protein n=1 Tax=Campylobacter hyointestinalis TaxID=198 RepID=A0A562XKK6_CAMHY|nr:hypothetical protein [Campylobacter hyointestinalis]TWO22610.1 hypothetical protein YZ82_01460 [Campylobacter hyointestinalis]
MAYMNLYGNIKCDFIETKDIWKIFINSMKYSNDLVETEVIWSLCNDFIDKFPKLEKEEELQKEFVELYTSKKDLNG